MLEIGEGSFGFLGRDFGVAAERFGEPIEVKFLSVVRIAIDDIFHVIPFVII